MGVVKNEAILRMCPRNLPVGSSDVDLFLISFFNSGEIVIWKIDLLITPFNTRFII